MKKAITCLAMCVGVFQVACEDVDSEDIMTSGIYASVEATANGDGQSQITTSLRVGGANSNTFLSLMGNDKLVASMGDAAKNMVEKTLLGSVWYEAQFAADAAGTEFKVDFQRTVDDSAPNSVVTMPAPFSISAPTGTPSYSRSSDDIVVSWDAASDGDKMNIAVDDTIDGSGNCVQIYSKDIVDDPGTYTIPAGSIVAREDHESETCTATIVLTRRRDGSLDPAYGEGGVAYARQVRKVQITVAP